MSWTYAPQTYASAYSAMTASSIHIIVSNAKVVKKFCGRFRNSAKKILLVEDVDRGFTDFTILLLRTFDICDMFILLY